MAVTIRHLEVHLQVEGTDEEEVFARHFNKLMVRWDAAKQEQMDRKKLADSERRLTGPEQEDD